VALALIAFDFDPVFRLGDLVVRWETFALAATIVLAVSLAAILAGRMPAVHEAYPELGGRERGAWHLRRDDLLFLLLGVIPGAILGGRLGYILIHLDYYGSHPEFWFDPGQGSLELGLGVLGGTAAGALVAMVLEAPVGRWLHVAIVPILVGLGLGKLAMVLGGDGQGTPSSLPWATAYLGPGPWGSLAPEVPSHPAQAYEGVLVLIVATLMVGLMLSGRFREQDGRAFFAGLSLWGLARVESGFLWRDAEVIGPFRAAQVLAMLIAFASLGLFAWRAMQTGRSIDRIRGARFRIGRPAISSPAGFSPPRASLGRAAPPRPRYGVGQLAQAHPDRVRAAPASPDQTAPQAATVPAAIAEPPSLDPEPASWTAVAAAEPALDRAFEPEPILVAAAASAAEADWGYEPEPLFEGEPLQAAASRTEREPPSEPEPHRTSGRRRARVASTQLELSNEFEPELVSSPEPVPAAAAFAAVESMEPEAPTPGGVASPPVDAAAVAGEPPGATTPSKRPRAEPWYRGIRRRAQQPWVPAGSGWLTASPPTVAPPPVVALRLPPLPPSVQLLTSGHDDSATSSAPTPE
jgi:phosphatidylglycerol:prolipoprotein diacylglycerol transferase